MNNSNLTFLKKNIIGAEGPKVGDVAGMERLGCESDGVYKVKFPKNQYKYSGKRNKRCIIQKRVKCVWGVLKRGTVVVSDARKMLATK